MKKAIFSSLVIFSAQYVNAETESENFKYLVMDTTDAVSSSFDRDIKTFQYGEHLASCLSLAKTEDFEAAEDACSSAVSLSKRLEWPDQRLAKAYAYNNRGVVRSLASKNTDALDDFKRAVNFKEMDAIRANLEKMTSKINNT